MIVNTTLKQHNRVVYSSQAIQHVARQIESLYWESVKGEILGPSLNSTGVEIGSDLSNHSYASNPKMSVRIIGLMAFQNDREITIAIPRRRFAA